MRQGTPLRTAVTLPHVEDWMKKTGLITLLLSLVVFSSAFAAGEMTFGVAGGVAMPTGDLGDKAKMGFQAGVFGDYRINEQAALGLSVDYVKPGVKDEYIALLENDASYLAGTPVTVEASISIILITVYEKWMPPMKGNVAPYVVVGGGCYMMKSDVTVDPAGASGGDSATESNPGFFGGVGVDFKANPQVKVGVFARAHDIQTEGQSSMYFNAGVSVGFGMASK